MLESQEVRRNVIAELSSLAGLDASGIRVMVRAGVVALRGSVSSWPERRLAEGAAKRVAGVRAVSNALRVELPVQHVRPDAELAEAARTALRWSSAVPADRLGVSVREACVALDGAVETSRERDAAERAVEQLTGVLKVVNRIEVRPHPVPALRIREEIEAAYRRSARLDGQPVRVDAEGGGVTLTGRVRSWSDREEAERVAWATRGVHRVENRIAVGRGAPAAF